MNLFTTIDKFAGRWLNWRTEREAAKFIDELQLHQIDFDQGTTNIVISHSAIAYLASEAAKILDEANAENYVQFDMMPRPDHGTKPIRVTVQWMHGEAPASKAARLEKELEILSRPGNSKEYKERNER